MPASLRSGGRRHDCCFVRVGAWTHYARAVSGSTRGEVATNGGPIVPFFVEQVRATRLRTPSTKDGSCPSLPSFV